MSNPLQPVIDISAICFRLGINDAVISPGSRSAPITLSFARHPEIKTHIIPDERTAGFTGLGIAQATGRPVVLVCTSGSAAYNFAPAVAEAYYQQIPLLVLTADRPPEWTDQHDGQTIRQQEIFGRHVKKFFQWPVDLSHPDAAWQAHRSLCEAINISNAFPQGPVHINIPLREPFYPAEGEEYTYSKKLNVIEFWEGDKKLLFDRWRQLLIELSEYKKVLIIGGQHPHSRQLSTMVQELSSKIKIPVIADIISNLHPVEGAITQHDAFLPVLSDQEKEALRPELVISFGKSVISKNIKLYLRKYKPQAHWHIRSTDFVADPFQSLTRILDADVEHFFSGLINQYMPPQDSSYLERWQAANKKATKTLTSFMKKIPYGEFQAVYKLSQRMEGKTRLHLANSMAVRYANFCNLKNAEKDIAVFANRGTSGIDGCTSTAIGYAKCTKETVVLITGDIAFFYDRNAFWQNELPANLRIILLNNQAGGIFRMIKGPADQPELEPYFETPHEMDARKLAREYGLDHQLCQSKEELEKALSTFLDSGSRTRILEVCSESASNAEIMQTYKKALAKAFAGS